MSKILLFYHFINHLFIIYLSFIYHLFIIYFYRIILLFIFDISLSLRSISHRKIHEICSYLGFSKQLLKKIAFVIHL